MLGNGRLATLAFWVGLVALCWQASADQIPRPPMPIPAPILPPLIPPAAPTPIPAKLAPPLATMPISPPPFPVALPPTEYGHAYGGQLVITRWNDYDLIRLICKDNPDAIACSYRVYDIASGKPISCLIMLGPGTWEDERVMQHEMGHCNGWSNDHERARYGD